MGLSERQRPEPGVYFIGFFDVTGGSNIRTMDNQADYIAAIASGAIKLPGKAAMQQGLPDVATRAKTVKLGRAGIPTRLRRWLYFSPRTLHPTGPARRSTSPAACG